VDPAAEGDGEADDADADYEAEGCVGEDDEGEGIVAFHCWGLAGR
jgi:hypothetical protein